MPRTFADLFGEICRSDAVSLGTKYLYGEGEQWEYG
jgi:hypothetical protein